MSETVIYSEFALRLGGRIRFFRRQHGLKQKALADLLGYKSHATIGLMETGAQIPSLESTIALAKVFEVSLGDLLGELVFDESQGDYYEPWMVAFRDKITQTPQEYREGLADMLESIVLGLRSTVS